MCSIDDTEQYDSALARCEETAGNYGHTLDGTWYPVDERLHASICVLCGAMVWVTRPGQEMRGRIGGTALKEECSAGGPPEGVSGASRAIVQRGAQAGGALYSESR